MKIGIGKIAIGALAAVLVAPVVYSIIMAFVPDNDKSVLTNASQTSSLSGAELYSKCAPCHGDNGDGTEAYPPLNTLNKERLIEMITGYQQGGYGGANKKIMQVQVQGMSRADMQKLSEFVTKLPPKPKDKDEHNKMQKIKKEQQIDITGISS